MVLQRKDDVCEREKERDVGCALVHVGYLERARERFGYAEANLLQYNIHEGRRMNVNNSMRVVSITSILILY